MNVTLHVDEHVSEGYPAIICAPADFDEVKEWLESSAGFIQQVILYPSAAEALYPVIDFTLDTDEDEDDV